MTDIDDEVLQDLYTWVDQIPLSRPKKNICRDFSDGVLMAELIKNYFPKLVDMHNYQGANATAQKKKNWMLLNWKVFKKLNFELSEDVIENLINCKPGTVERVLLLLRTKMDRDLFQKKSGPAEYFDRPEADQDHFSPSGRHEVTPRRQSQGPPKVPIHGDRSSVAHNSHSVKKSTSLHNLGQADIVPRIAYEEKVQESLAKDETIEILQAKVRRLEHLLHLKDIRIDDLNARIEEIRPGGGRARYGGPK